MACGTAERGAEQKVEPVPLRTAKDAEAALGCSTGNETQQLLQSNNNSGSRLTPAPAAVKMKQFHHRVPHSGLVSFSEPEL